MGAPLVWYDEAMTISPATYAKTYPAVVNPKPQRKIQARDVPCPTCNAPAHTGCQRRRRKGKCKGYHWERRNTARIAEQALNALNPLT